MDGVGGVPLVLEGGVEGSMTAGSNRLTEPPVEQTDFVDFPASLANSSLKSLSGLAAGPNATDD